MYDPLHTRPIEAKNRTGGWFLPALGGMAFDNFAWPVLGWLAQGRPPWGPYGSPPGVNPLGLSPLEVRRLHEATHPTTVSGAFPWAPVLGGIVASRYLADLMQWGTRDAVRYVIQHPAPGARFSALNNTSGTTDDEVNRLDEEGFTALNTGRWLRLILKMIDAGDVRVAKVLGYARAHQDNPNVRAVTDSLNVALRSRPLATATLCQIMRSEP